MSKEIEKIIDWEIESTYGIDHYTNNPLFQNINTSEDFFSDLQVPKTTSIIKREPTIREKLIEKRLIEDKANKEEMKDFREHFWKTDEDILNTYNNQETKKMLEWFLNEEDQKTLDNFLVMSYRNNLWYWVALNNIF
jgi:hypothetical protein